MPTAEERERLADVPAQERGDTPPDSPQFMLSPVMCRYRLVCIPITMMRSCSPQGNCARMGC
jgi:hypothetical protein